jgi:hypothetical protein
MAASCRASLAGVMPGAGQAGADSGLSVGLGAEDGADEVGHPLHSGSKRWWILGDAGSGVSLSADDQADLVRHGYSPRVSMPPHTGSIESNSLINPYRKQIYNQTIVWREFA